MTDGRDAERELMEHYEAAGFECYQPPRAKYREQDVFGLFDVLAIGHTRLECIQVKAGRDAAGVISWFTDAQSLIGELRDVHPTFAHLKDGHWRLARARGDSYRWIYDGRPATETQSGDLADILRR